jgi:hypothetical protein
MSLRLYHKSGGYLEAETVAIAAQNLTSFNKTAVTHKAASRPKAVIISQSKI